MLSSNPTEKPNHDNANTANIASRLTVRDVGKLFNALRPAALTITAHPPSIITHVISGAVRVKRIREKISFLPNSKNFLLTSRGIGYKLEP